MIILSKLIFISVIGYLTFSEISRTKDVKTCNIYFVIGLIIIIAIATE